MREIYVIAHDMRSTFNIGSLLRTAEGLGVKKVYLTGYTPYPLEPNDTRLPHISKKLDAQISKTALGAEKTLAWEYYEDIQEAMTILHDEQISIVALEQTDSAVALPDFQPSEKLALLLGTEVTGIPKPILDQVPLQVFIPMFGQKESFNVVQAAAMALYDFRFR